MSEADRVFFARKGQKSQNSTSEQRLILSTSRRSGPGAGKSRMVEVVHVRRDGARPVKDDPSPAQWSLRAEVRPEGLRAKPPEPLPLRDIQPVAPAPTPPVVHVMPMWQPSPPGPKPDELPIETAVAGPRKPCVRKSATPNEAVRRFADPFADDDGANCLRCGYLVEPAREKRGLMTCSACG
jgi:hypothetical protein